MCKTSSMSLLANFLFHQLAGTLDPYARKEFGSGGFRKSQKKAFSAASAPPRSSNAPSLTNPVHVTPMLNSTRSGEILRSEQPCVTLAVHSDKNSRAPVSL